MRMKCLPAARGHSSCTLIYHTITDVPTRSQKIACSGSRIKSQFITSGGACGRSGGCDGSGGSTLMCVSHAVAAGSPAVLRVGM